MAASSNGTVELVLALFGEEVEQAACVEFAVTLTSESPEGQFTQAVCSQWKPIFKPLYAGESRCSWDIDSVQCHGCWWETNCNWKTCAEVSCKSHKCIYRVQIVLKKSIAGSGNNFHIVSNGLWWAHSPFCWRKEYFENSAAGDHQRWPAHGFWFSLRFAGSSANSPSSKTTMQQPKVMMVWCLGLWRSQRRLLCRNVYFSKQGSYKRWTYCGFVTLQINDPLKLFAWHACQTRPH